MVEPIAPKKSALSAVKTAMNKVKLKVAAAGDSKPVTVSGQAKTAKISQVLIPSTPLRSAPLVSTQDSRKLDSAVHAGDSAALHRPPSQQSARPASAARQRPSSSSGTGYVLSGRMALAQVTSPTGGLRSQNISQRKLSPHSTSITSRSQDKTEKNEDLNTTATAALIRRNSRSSLGSRQGSRSDATHAQLTKAVAAALKPNVSAPKPTLSSATPSPSKASRPTRSTAPTPRKVSPTTRLKGTKSAVGTPRQESDLQRSGKGRFAVSTAPSAATTPKSRTGSRVEAGEKSESLRAKAARSTATTPGHDAEGGMKSKAKSTAALRSTVERPVTASKNSNRLFVPSPKRLMPGTNNATPVSSARYSSGGSQPASKRPQSAASGLNSPASRGTTKSVEKPKSGTKPAAAHTTQPIAVEHPTHNGPHNEDDKRDKDKQHKAVENHAHAAPSRAAQEVAAKPAMNGHAHIQTGPQHSDGVAAGTAPRAEEHHKPHTVDPEVLVPFDNLLSTLNRLRGLFSEPKKGEHTIVSELLQAEMELFHHDCCLAEEQTCVILSLMDPRRVIDLGPSDPIGTRFDPYTLASRCASSLRRTDKNVDALRVIVKGETGEISDAVRHQWTRLHKYGGRVRCREAHSLLAGWADRLCRNLDCTPAPGGFH